MYILSEEISLFKPTRQFIAEGKAKHKKLDISSGSKITKEKDCILFLFNDSLLIVNPINDTAHDVLYDFVALLKWKFRPATRVVDVRPSTSDSRTFLVVSPRDLCNHFIAMETVEERDSWMSMVTQTVAKHQQDKQQRIETLKERRDTQFDVKKEQEQQQQVQQVLQTDTCHERIQLGTEDVLSLISVWGTLTFQISNTVTVPSQNEKEFTAYVIVMMFESGSVTVLKRFSQIHALHKAVSKHYGGSKNLPAKMPGKKWIGNTDTTFVQQRCHQLQVYLNGLTTLRNIFEITAMIHFITTGLSASDEKNEDEDEE